MRVGVAAIGVIMATVASARAEDWSIRSPDNWVRVDASGAFDDDLVSAPARRYTSPEVSTDELAVMKGEFHGKTTPRDLVETLLARIVVNPSARVEKQQTSGHLALDGVGEMTIVDGDTIRQYRIVASRNQRDHWIDAVIGRCTTSKAMSRVCADALATIKLEVKSMPPAIDDGMFLRLPWLTILAILCGVVWSIMIVRYLLRRRAMRKKTPLADGELVTLTGRVRLVEPHLTAPLSGTQCVVHRSRMYLLGSPDAKDNAVTESARFVVETPNGDVIVDSTPELDLVPSPVVPRQENRELSFMTSRNIPEARHRDAGFDEIVIAPGATVVIRGMVRVERDHGAGGERGYRDDAPTVTRLVGTPDKPLTIKKTW